MKKAPISIPINPVAKSSTIAGHGYHPESRTLAVQFKGGGKVYHYAGVPQSVVDALGKAESAGKFITGQIVGKYKHSVPGAKKP